MTSPFTECTPGATLGLGEDLRVFLTTRGATRLLAELPVTGGSFTRKLDATSECQVSGVFSGSDAECCDGWIDAVPWATELLILRDGRDAWAGPITGTNFARGSVTIDAADLSAWWDRRRVPDLKFVDYCPCFGFRDIHIAAMAPDPVPNFDLFIQNNNTGTVRVDRTYLLSDQQYASEALDELAKTAVDWTAFGRTVIISQDEIDVPPYATMLDDWWDEPPEVQVLGNEQATRVIVTGKNDIVAVATADAATIATYGLLERVFSEPNIEDQRSLDYAAMTRLDYLSQPLFITPPQGATLKPTAPITVAELVPGIRVRVDTSATCRRVVADFRLQGVKVDFDGKVAVDLQPVGHYIGQDETATFEDAETETA